MATSQRPVLALVLLWIIWGYSWVVLKLALNYADPFVFSALRVGLGALCLFALMAIQRHTLRPRHVRELIWLGCVQTSAFVGLSMWATAEGAAGRTAILVFTMPFWTVLLAWLVLGERMRRAQILTALLAAAGLVLILQPWQLAGPTQSKLLAIASGLAWGISAVMVKRMQKRTPMDLLSMTAWQMLFGTVPLALLVLVIPTAPVQWTREFVFALAFTSVFTTAAGWWLWLYVLHRLPTGVAGMSTFAIPVIAMFSAWLQLGERPEPIELAGILLIVVALLILSVTAVRQHRSMVAPMGQE